MAGQARRWEVGKEGKGKDTIKRRRGNKDEARKAAFRKDIYDAGVMPGACGRSGRA